MKLKSYAIIEAFGSLDEDEKRKVLEELIKQTNVIEVKRNFTDARHETFYEFMRKQWPRMSSYFFNETLRRWEILKDKSYGNAVTSTYEDGDLYLQSSSWLHRTKIYTLFPKDFFYDEVCRVCKWDEMFICKYDYDLHRYSIIKLHRYSIIKLMELNKEEFEKVMSEYGYN